MDNLRKPTVAARQPVSSRQVHHKLAELYHQRALMDAAIRALEKLTWQMEQPTLKPAA